MKKKIDKIENRKRVMSGETVKEMERISVRKETTK